MATGACTVTGQSACAYTWIVGAVCSVQICPVPPADGACCDVNTGDCTITAATACRFSWFGPGSVCNTQICPPPVTTGACCFRNAYCRILPLARCQALRGTFMNAPVCTPNPTTPCYVWNEKSGGPLPDDNGPVEQKDSWGQIKNRYR
jgi:hypothetical protein